MITGMTNAKRTANWCRGKANDLRRVAATQAEWAVDFDKDGDPIHAAKCRVAAEETLTEAQRYEALAAQ